MPAARNGDFLIQVLIADWLGRLALVEAEPAEVAGGHRVGGVRRGAGQGREQRGDEGGDQDGGQAGGIRVAVRRDG